MSIALNNEELDSFLKEKLSKNSLYKEFNYLVKEENKLIKANKYSIYDLWKAFFSYISKEDCSFFIKSSIKYNGVKIPKEIWVDSTKKAIAVNNLIKIRVKTLQEIEKDINYFEKFGISVDYNLIENAITIKQELNYLNEKLLTIVKTNNKSEYFMSFEEFKNIYNSIYYKAGDKIIEGKIFNLGSTLGFIEARRVKRNFNRKTVKFNNTKEGKNESLKYFCDDFYLCIGWSKTKFVKNIYDYSAKTVQGNFNFRDNENRLQGLRLRFSSANMQDKNLKLKYRYFSTTKEHDIL